jgi:hypothetical protein
VLPRTPVHHPVSIASTFDSTKLSLWQHHGSTKNLVILQDYHRLAALTRATVARKTTTQSCLRLPDAFVCLF